MSSKKEMTLNEYQSKATKTADYPILRCYKKIKNKRGTIPSKDFADVSFVYPALGLAGEAGEVVEKIKKVVRNKNGHLSKKDVNEIGKELSDCIWYIAELCTSLGLSLGKVAEDNLKKLASRQKRGKIKSKGDNR